MRVLFLGDPSNPLVGFLKSVGEDVHVTTDKINGKEQKEWLQEFDFVVSYGYRHIVRKSVIDLFPNKIINLHISFLPYNRGADPNLWSWIESTSAGVTIHKLDPGLDTGEILIQKKVNFRNSDGDLTLASTYTKLQKEICQLFQENWDRLKKGEMVKIPQDNSLATFHYAKHKEVIMEKFIMPNGGWNISIKLLMELIPEIQKTLSSS